MAVAITNNTPSAAPQRIAYFTLRAAALLERMEQRALYPYQITQEAKGMLGSGEGWRAERFLSQAFQRSADTTVGNMLISVIGKNGYHREDEGNGLKQAWDVFAIMRELGTADSFTYNSMMHTYALVGKADRARKVFDMAVEAGAEDLVSYKTVIDAYYRARQFGKVLTFIREAPVEMKETEDLRLSEIECLRKIRRYDEALDRIQEVAQDPTFSGEALERALVNGACCIKEMGDAEGAVSELRRLLGAMDGNSKSRLRAMSLLVLWGGLEAHEAPEFRKEMVRIADVLNGNKGSVMEHYTRALEVIGGMLAEGKEARA